MNSETPQPSREQIEIRLTALLLGELPPAEAELLRWNMAQDPELAKLHDRLKSTIGLVREVSAQPVDETAKSSAPLKMSEERRQKLLAHFKTVKPKEFETTRIGKTNLQEGNERNKVVPVPGIEIEKRRGRFSWFIPLAAVLMVLGLLVVMLLPKLAGTSERARVSSLAYEGQDLESQSTLSTPAKHFFGGNKNSALELEPQALPDLAALKTNTLHSWNTGGLFGDVTAAKLPNRSPLATTIALPPTDAGGNTITVAPATPTTFANRVGSSGGFAGGGGAGGSGFGGGAAGNKLGDLAGNRFKTVNGVVSQGIVGQVNLTNELPDTSTTATFAFNTPPQAGEPAPAQRFYRELNSDGAAVDKKLPEAGANRTVYKDSKKDTLALADTSNSGAIVLPPNSVSEDVVVAPMPASGSTFNDRFDLGVASNGASKTTVEKFDDSTKLAYNLQPDANGGEMQQGERRERITNGQNTWDAPVQNGTYAIAGSTARSTLQTRETQNATTDMPGAPSVIGGIPPPVSVSIPASVVTQGQFPRGAQVAVNNPASAPVMMPAPAPNAMPVAPAVSMPIVSGSPLSGDQVAKDQDASINKPPDMPIPQPEVFTKDNTFSTFSLNVSDVSYKLAAASLENGQMPPPGAIRSEEFLNAFDYRDPEPPAGSPIGFAWERAGDPFAHNRDFLRFSVKTAAAGRAANRTLNLVILLDKSGSMERADRVAIIQEALKVLASQLKAHDKLSVITFARTARLYADGVSGKQASKVFGKVSKITPEGGTNLEEAMNLAYQTALRHYLTEGVNRVVLLTDGAANLGDVDPNHLRAKVEKYRKQGVALDCFGIGWEDYNDDLLADLASHADGRYGFLNHPEDAAEGFASQLAGALKVAAADVKVQVEFNPARVTAYRQIGYAKHQLTKEQFRDNTVVAAAIGAAEAGNGLYAVQINPEGDGPVATVRVRFHTPGKQDYQERSWIVSYNGTAVALDRASPAMRLAATASSFAEWLQSSPYASEVTADKLLEYLKGVPEIYGADKRPQKLEWMIRQAQSILGKG